MESISVRIDLFLELSFSTYFQGKLFIWNNISIFCIKIEERSIEDNLSLVSANKALYLELFSLQTTFTNLQFCDTGRYFKFLKRL